MSEARRRGPIWIGLIVVAVFFGGVTLAIAMLGGGPDIPHAVAGGQTTCTGCHATARLPESHRDQVDANCRSCHSVSRDADEAVHEPGGAVGDTRATAAAEAVEAAAEAVEDAAQAIDPGEAAETGEAGGDLPGSPGSSTPVAQAPEARASAAL